MAASTSSMLSLYDDISADDRAEGDDATALRPKAPSSTNATPQNNQVESESLKQSFCRAQLRIQQLKNEARGRVKENFELKETPMQANFQLRSNKCGLHDALDLASANAALEQQLKVLEHQHTELSDLITKADELATGNTISQDSHSKRTGSAHNTDEMLISMQEDWCGRGSHIEFKRGETIPL